MMTIQILPEKRSIGKLLENNPPSSNSIFRGPRFNMIIEQNVSVTLSNLPKSNISPPSNI
jgi:hypothetical protein